MDLANIAIPHDGWNLKRNSYCNKKFHQGKTCRDFYQELGKSGRQGEIVQCPFGFSCLPFDLAGRPFVLTCFVPAPRMGGEEERSRAKNHPETRISAAEVHSIAANLHKAEAARLDSVVGSLKEYPAALHEIRKYNRTIKQESERLCLEESPTDPDKADPRLVRIFKCSELMTVQFEILELIANQSLVDLPLNTTSEIYKIFDKCVRIYRDRAALKNVTLRIEGDSPKALVNDKTFPIIATVLLENAVKYSLSHTEVLVRIQSLNSGRCRIEVNNIAPHVIVLPDIFGKGVRGNEDGTGMGHGLFLAQLVAKQHNSVIKLDRRPYLKANENYIFSFELKAFPAGLSAPLIT